MKRALLALLLTGLATSAIAQEQQQPSQPNIGNNLPAAVAEEQITVSSDYRGSFVTVFGVNPDRRGRGDIVVVVRGPDTPVTVMRKRRVFGLWVNGDPVRFSRAPSFFAVLSNRPVGRITTGQSIFRNGLDPAATAQLASGTGDLDPAPYRAALVRLRRAQGLYQWYSGRALAEQRGGLTMYQGGLFRAVVRLPANAPIARYHADTYLFRDGRLISSQRIPITISRVGFERRIHDLATSFSWLYGVVTVGIAMLAGWIAALLFRRT